MVDILNFFKELFKNIKNKKILVWIFIIFILGGLILYPIIDANFLYYGRINKRIEILKNITTLDQNKIEENQNLKQEYESILIDMSSQRDKYMDKIIRVESSSKENLIKGIASSWIFLILFIIIPFIKDKKTQKILSKNNILGAVVCLGISIFLMYISKYIPIVINVMCTCIIIEIIIFYLIYTIASFGNKKEQ